MKDVSFWSFASMQEFVIAVPYTDEPDETGPYVWANQGAAAAGNSFSRPSGAPGGRVGAVVGQFLMLGDVYETILEVVATGDGTSSSFAGALTHLPMLAAGSVYDQNGLLGGTFNQGLITGSGLLAKPQLPGMLGVLADFFANDGSYLYSKFALTTANNPGQSAFASITAHAVTLASSAAIYSYVGGVATWQWSTGPFGFGAGITYPVTFVPSSLSTSIIGQNGTLDITGFGTGNLRLLADVYLNGTYASTQLEVEIATDPGKTVFSSMTVNGVALTSSAATYSFAGGVATWTWTTEIGITNAAGYKVAFASSVFTGGKLTAGHFNQSAPHAGPGPGGGTSTDWYGFGDAYAGLGPGIGAFDGTQSLAGYNLSTGTGSVETANSSTVNYETGNVSIVLSAAPPAGDAIYAKYTNAAPYRVQWSAIGDPTNWPVPLTAAAYANQSGYEDLNSEYGPVMGIAGYPLYCVIMQRTAIQRAGYQGGDVVFSFGIISKNRGCIAKGAWVQVGLMVYFLSQDGFFVTDGNSVSPIGTDQDNDAGIDNWFWNTVNVNELESIRSGYSSKMRCVVFAIPTGTNTELDTLLLYNPQANRWTRSQVPCEIVWTDSNGSNVQATEFRLGLFTAGSQYSLLSGPQLSGYAETIDFMPVDGIKRFTDGATPNCASIDTPTVSVGVRDSPTDAITYSPQQPPDPFSRIVPAMVEGRYTRARVGASQASSMNGVMLSQSPTSGV